MLALSQLYHWENWDYAAKEGNKTEKTKMEAASKSDYFFCWKIKVTGMNPTICTKDSKTILKFLLPILASEQEILDPQWMESLKNFGSDSDN